MQSKIKASKYFISLFFLLFFGLCCYSQTYKNEIGIISENDFYIAFNKDRYYTEGAFAYYRHALRQENLDPKFEKKIVDVEIGHKIYNPYWSNAPDPKQHDRPFAGYAYVSAGLGWFYKNESILKASVQIGILGPNSMAEQTQKFFHEKILKAYYPVEGWQYQVKNELGLNFDLSYQTLFYHSANRIFDISGSSAVQIGNTFSGANAGLVFRFGKMNPYYESSFANSRIKNKRDGNTKTPIELYFFTKPQLNFALYDGTIQGGLLRSDKGPVTFGLKHWVYAQQFGLNFAWKRLSAKMIVTAKTREVESSAKPYQYASAVFAYHFN